MGVGPITSVSGDSGFFCYKNDVSSKLCLLKYLPRRSE
jgi:hypothetical protein